MNLDAAHDIESEAISLPISSLRQVAAIARETACPDHPVLDIRDVYQEGVIGFINARRLFDPTKGLAFSTYARYRIRGAIKDAYRSHAPGRHNSALSPIQREEMRDNYRQHCLRLEYENTLEDTVVNNVLHHEVAHLVDTLLPARTRRIFILYYRDGWTMAAIGRKLGLIESRISQIHTEALTTLRQHLDA